MIHGIIDIGSNTVRMAIYDIAGEKIDFLMKKKHPCGADTFIPRRRSWAATKSRSATISAMSSRPR